VTPADGSLEADPAGSVRIEFSEELDAATVSSETIIVTDGVDPIAGSITYTGRRVTFTPKYELSLLSGYVLTGKSAVSDLDGAPMLEDVVSRFAVRDGSWGTAKLIAASSRFTGLGADGHSNFIVGHDTRGSAYSGGAWATATDVDCDDCFVNNVMAGNSNGDALAVGMTNYGIVLARSYGAGAWDTEDENICEATSYVPNITIAAGMAPTGEGYVIIFDDPMVRIRKIDPDGAWSGSDITDEGGDPFSGTPPIIVFNNKGDGLATWVPTSPSSVTRRFVRFEPGTAPPSELADGPIGADALAIAENGDAMAIWGTRYLSWSHYTKTGWSGERSLEVQPMSGTPVLVADGNDFVAAWQQRASDSAPCMVYSSRWHNGNWSDAELRSDPTKPADCTQAPLLGADVHGNLMLFWTSGSEANYARFNGATGSWTDAQTAFGAAVTAERALAISANGTLITAFNSNGNVYAAVFQ